jgi:hypothetical protein
MRGVAIGALGLGALASRRLASMASGRTCIIGNIEQGALGTKD